MAIISCSYTLWWILHRSPFTADGLSSCTSLRTIRNPGQISRIPVSPWVEQPVDIWQAEQTSTLGTTWSQTDGKLWWKQLGCIMFYYYWDRNNYRFSDIDRRIVLSSTRVMAVIIFFPIYLLIYLNRPGQWSQLKHSRISSLNISSIPSLNIIGGR